MCAGFHTIAGVDEAGRGPLAGPVVAAACIIPHDVFIIGIDDSKKLSPKQRCALFEELTSRSDIRYHVGIISHQEIDEINILQATIKAMQVALHGLDPAPDLTLVDGLSLTSHLPCKKIIGGDALSQSIAAASVIAKETRDRIMTKYHEEWPHYGFHQHKGYGTKQHLEALNKHGACPIHRKSFKPITS